MIGQNLETFHLLCIVMPEVDYINDRYSMGCQKLDKFHLLFIVVSKAGYIYDAYLMGCQNWDTIMTVIIDQTVNILQVVS